MRIITDLGRTLITREENCPPFPNAIEVLQRLKSAGHELFVVSKVNSVQQESAREWLKNHNIYDLIPENNVYYCFERRDKGFFVNGLNADIMIDDRPEVMAFINKGIYRILFNPWPADLGKWANKIGFYEKANSWLEIENLINKYYNQL